MNKISIAQRRLRFLDLSRAKQRSVGSPFSRSSRIRLPENRVMIPHQVANAHALRAAIPLAPEETQRLDSMLRSRRQDEQEFRATLRKQDHFLLLELNLDEMPGTKKYLTAAEVAERLAISRRTVYRLVEQGWLRARRIGRMLRFPPEDVSRFLSGCRQPAQQGD